MKTTIPEFKNKYPKLIQKFERSTGYNVFWQGRITRNFIQWLQAKIKGLICNDPNCPKYGKEFHSKHAMINHLYQHYNEETDDLNKTWNDYIIIHQQVRKIKVKPENCELCGLPEFYENLGKLILSDKTGLCLSDVNNFQYVHVSCHRQYDKENKIVHIKLPFKSKFLKI